MSRSKKYSKKRPIKAFSIGLLLLCSVSLLSVGFSTWYYGVDSKGEGTVQIEIADTVNKNSFITFDGDAEVFQYTDTALVKDDVADPSYTEAYIYVPFQMDVKDKKLSDCLGENATSFSIRTALVDNTTLHAVFDVGKVTEGKLVYKTENSFTDSDFTDVTVHHSSTTEYKKDYDSGIDFTINDFPYLDESKVYFKVQLKLTFTYTTSFNADVYTKLDNGSFKFGFKAGVLN